MEKVIDRPVLRANSIAGAVAREIERGEVEGIAYKAEWDRRGSDAILHIRQMRADQSLMLTRAVSVCFKPAKYWIDGACGLRDDGYCPYCDLRALK